MWGCQQRKVPPEGHELVFKNDEDEIIGRQYNHYYATEETAQEKLLETIAYIDNLLFDEGFYLIENILTLPYHTQDIDDLNACLPLCLDGCNTCKKIDPFSYQVTIIFPGYTTRFSSIDFRVYMENLIRRELPAHILPRICWVGHIDGALATIEEKLRRNTIEVLQTAKHDQILPREAALAMARKRIDRAMSFRRWNLF